ncbi:cytochrome P450 [Seongchinamella unica]|uniref:cytochrome P450 n=1 Tax=Seongchinamella unica TaxID=2547392 RepID=UPI001EEF1851|nr:cytochrome P450 [Seongchinamella unica]
MSRSLQDYNFFSEEVLECPFDFYRLAREEAPVYLLPGSNIYLVTRHADIRAMLKDTETFSSNFAHLLSGAGETEEVRALYEGTVEPADTLLTLDPPRHRVYRSLVNKVFSARRVQQMHDYIEQIVDELIDGFIDDGECEFIAAFASPLPLMVIADQLGIDRELLPRFKVWSDSLAARLGGMVSPEQAKDIALAVREFQQYILGVIDARRREPRDDMISDLATAEIDDGRSLSDAELISIVQQFLVAGNETTTSSLAGGMLSLIRNPQQMCLLREGPLHMANAVEEILRMETPSAGLWRAVTRDVEFNGTLIPAGAMVMLRYAAANRDERVFDDAERFDICRHNADDHIAFGQGTHFCPGAMLARKEMIVGLGKLLERLDNIQLAEGKNDLSHWPNMVLRGLKSLHITFDKRPRRATRTLENEAS